jgi:hypothetical protein
MRGSIRRNDPGGGQGSAHDARRRKCRSFQRAPPGSYLAAVNVRELGGAERRCDDSGSFACAGGAECC